MVRGWPAGNSKGQSARWEAQTEPSIFIQSVTLSTSTPPGMERWPALKNSARRSLTNTHSQVKRYRPAPAEVFSYPLAGPCYSITSDKLRSPHRFLQNKVYGTGSNLYHLYFRAWFILHSFIKLLKSQSSITIFLRISWDLPDKISTKHKEGV